MCPTLGPCTLGASRLGEEKEAASVHHRAPSFGESCTLRPPPPLQDPGEGRRVVPQGLGAEINGSAWGGGAWERRLRPPPPPEGKGRRWPARTEPDAATRAAGAAGPGPGGTERVGAGEPPARSRARPLLPRPPPLRAGPSIHKFSSCSAATERRSQPGAPRRRPPARSLWAALPALR